MFTTKPESGEKITKLGGGVSDAKTPFTERPATYASKSPGPTASKMVPSIIGEDLTIRGNVTSKGEIQIDGEIEGDIRCGSLLLGDKSKVTGGVAAEDVVVRGHLVGSIRGLRITLQAQSHVEGDICPPEPCHRAGCLFRRKVAPLRQSTRGDQGSGRKWLVDLRVPFREFTERGVSRRGGIATGCRRVSASTLSKPIPMFGSQAAGLHSAYTSIPCRSPRGKPERDVDAPLLHIALRMPFNRLVPDNPRHWSSTRALCSGSISSRGWRQVTSMSHLLIKVDALHANGINCGMSALPPKADVRRARSKSPLCANSRHSGSTLEGSANGS